jgi:hypothetical protein
VKPRIGTDRQPFTEVLRFGDSLKGIAASFAAAYYTLHYDAFL